MRRIIPTYVGSTLRQACRLQRTPNHSHVCGINEPREPTDSCDDESVPRMWDQLRASLLRFRTSRIIPTYVGSTAVSDTRTLIKTNHSHVCGINMDCTTVWSECCESFPRMWDQHCKQTELTRCKRIIPTYVGSTLQQFQ